MMPYIVTRRQGQPMPDLKDYMSTEDAAKELSLHVETIREFLRYKRLDGIKVGRTWLVSRKAVMAYQRRTAGKEKHDPGRSNGR